MRRAILILTLLAAALWSAPSLAQSRAQLGPLCTTDTTPADQQIDACNKIIALKVFSGEKLATIYFWRAVGWNKKGNYTQVIADAGEAIRLHPSVAAYNLRGSAYYDKGEDDIAISDFNDALRIGPPSGIIFHNRGNAWRSKGEYAKAIADYDQSIKLGPPSAFSWQNRGISKRALGDLDGALADINEAIRLDPTLPQPLTSRAVIWRAKGDLDRAIADTTEAIRLAKAKAPVNIMTPPGSVLISAYTHRALAYEAKGDFDRAKQDYAATLEGKASDAGSKANQATAKVRLSLLSETLPPSPRTATAAPPPPASKAAPASPAGAASPSPPPAAEQRKRAETGRETGRRVALVIGNGAYARVRPLPNPTNDARAMAKSLRDIGFVVTEGTDLDRAAMQATIRDFLRDAARSQVAVVYYAGHGVQIDGRNYLVPVDIQFQSRQRHDRCDDGHGYDHGRPRRSGPHQHPDPRCLPQQPDGAEAGFRRSSPRHRSRLGAGRARYAWRRLDVGCGHADRICNRARTGRAGRRRRQQPVLGRADAPHRHAGAGGAADADAGPRRGGRGDQGQAGAVVELVAAGRGLSGGEIIRLRAPRRPSRPSQSAAPRCRFRATARSAP